MKIADMRADQPPFSTLGVIVASEIDTRVRENGMSLDFNPNTSRFTIIGSQNDATVATIRDIFVQFAERGWRPVLDEGVLGADGNRTFTLVSRSSTS